MPTRPTVRPTIVPEDKPVCLAEDCDTAKPGGEVEVLEAASDEETVVGDEVEWYEVRVDIVVNDVDDTGLVMGDVDDDTGLDMGDVDDDTGSNMIEVDGTEPMTVTVTGDPVSITVFIVTAVVSALIAFELVAIGTAETIPSVVISVKAAGFAKEIRGGVLTVACRGSKAFKLVGTRFVDEINKSSIVVARLIMYCSPRALLLVT
jgi:hypothetical protein